MCWVEMLIWPSDLRACLVKKGRLAAKAMTQRSKTMVEGSRVDSSPAVLLELPLVVVRCLETNTTDKKDTTRMIMMP